MRFCILILISMTLLSCETMEIENKLEVPSAYDGSDFSSNAQDELKMVGALKNLSTEMKKGRTGEKVNEELVKNYFEQLGTITSDYFGNLVRSELLVDLVNDSGGELLNSGVHGGVYVSYLFNKYGIENEQLIEKGLYAAALYKHAALLSQNPDEKTSDKILALFGAHPDFASSNNSTLHQNPDQFIASYVARRDKNDGNGYYSNVQNGLITLQAAIKAGSAFDTERLSATQMILENWEKGSAATAINYMYSVLSKLSATKPVDADFADALHSYSEILGFIHGYRTVENKIITDQEIDEILTLLNAPVGQTPTTLNIIDSPETELSKILQVMDKLQSIYGFSDQEMEEFKINWVGEQKR